MKHLCILLIRLYQWAIAPLKRLLSGGKGSCRFEPSCSYYAIDALQTHGFFKGIVLGGLRILRCQPWGGYGLDRVPSRASWKQIIGLRSTAETWLAHAKAMDGTVLVHRGRFVAEGETPAATMDTALQGSRHFDGGTLYSVIDCADSDTIQKLLEHHIDVENG